MTAAMENMKTVDDAAAWAAVMARDAEWDGRFVFAVRTTGVYCRPSCPSRRPRRENVSFFAAPTAAERAGFRACRRCRPTAEARPAGAEHVGRAREFLDRQLEARPDERVTLEQVAEAAGVSPFHLQRTFKRLTGVSPAEYVRERRRERLKRELRRGETVSRATYGAGYGSSSRVYEDARGSLGMTPAAYRRGGSGEHIRHVTVPTRFGTLLVAATGRGVCAVQLGDDATALAASLAAEYPRATREAVSLGDDELGGWVAAIVRHLEGDASTLDLPLDLRATAFQWRVWRALREIPYGETRSYAAVARAIGAPQSARAVAGACARNRVAVVIPCHRVVREGGELGGYKWGAERKRRLLEQERRG